MVNVIRIRIGVFFLSFTEIPGIFLFPRISRLVLYHYNEINFYDATSPLVSFSLLFTLLFLFHFDTASFLITTEWAREREREREYVWNYHCQYVILLFFFDMYNKKIPSRCHMISAVDYPRLLLILQFMYTHSTTHMKTYSNVYS